MAEVQRSVGHPIDAAELLAQVPRSRLIDDTEALLWARGDCEAAQAAYALVIANCWQSSLRYCRESREGAARLSPNGEMSISLAEERLLLGSAFGEGPAHICGSSVLRRGRERAAESDMELAEEAIATYRQYTCAGAKRW